MKEYPQFCCNVMIAVESYKKTSQPYVYGNEAYVCEEPLK